MYVGDGVRDITAARQAGIASTAVLWGKDRQTALARLAPRSKPPTAPRFAARLRHSKTLNSRGFAQRRAGTGQLEAKLYRNTDKGIDGKSTLNVDPLPSSLWTPMAPPWASTICLLIYNPKPSPLMFRCDTARSNRLKIVINFSAAMPMPSSATMMRAPKAVCWTLT